MDVVRETMDGTRGLGAVGLSGATRTYAPFSVASPASDATSLSDAHVPSGNTLMATVRSRRVSRAR